MREQVLKEWNNLKKEIKLLKDVYELKESDLQREKGWWNKWINDNKLIFNRDNERLLADYEEIFRNMSSANARLDFINVNATMPHLERSIAFKETIRRIYQYYLNK